MNWDDNPSGTPLDNYVVYRSTTANFDDAIEIATVTQNQYADTSVSPVTTYYYWVTALGNSWESAVSNVASATTTIIAPSQPGADAVHDTEVNLSWTDTIDADPGEDGYRIEKSENGGASFTLVADVAPNATGYTVIDLKASTAYTFRISAFKGSTFSDAITATATTPAPPEGEDLGTATANGMNHDPGYFANGQDLPAGRYRVEYVSGAYETNLNPPHSWLVYATVEYSGGADLIATDIYESEAAVEEHPPGSIIIDHQSDGPILMRGSDPDTNGNQNGGLQTFRLIRLPNLPEVSIEATKTDAKEDGDNDEDRKGTLTITRSGGDLSQSLEVFLHPLAGTARPGSDKDFSDTASSLTFDPYETVKTLDLLPLADDVLETAETIVGYVKGAADYLIGSVTSTAITIANDDTPIVSAYFGSDAIEGSPSLGYKRVVFSIERKDPRAATTSLAVTFTLPASLPASATEGTDYEPVTKTITFQPGETKATVVITPKDDDIVETSEIIDLTLTESPNYRRGDPRQEVGAPWRRREGAERLRYKVGRARAYIEDTDLGLMPDQSYGSGTTMNALPVDGTAAAFNSPDNCQSWAFNSAAFPARPTRLTMAIPYAVSRGLFDGDDTVTLDDVLSDFLMMRRVFEAMIFDDNSPLEGYRCAYDAATPFNVGTLTGFHMITPYWRNTTGGKDFHFATKDYDPITGQWSWSDKENNAKATDTDPYDESSLTVHSVILGHYMVNSAPRDARAST